MLKSLEALILKFARGIQPDVHRDLRSSSVYRSGGTCDLSIEAEATTIVTDCELLIGTTYDTILVYYVDPAIDRATTTEANEVA